MNGLAKIAVSRTPGTAVWAPAAGRGDAEVLAKRKQQPRREHGDHGQVGAQVGNDCLSLFFKYWLWCCTTAVSSFVGVTASRPDGKFR